MPLQVLQCHGQKTIAWFWFRWRDEVVAFMFALQFYLKKTLEPEILTSSQFYHSSHRHNTTYNPRDRFPTMVKSESAKNVATEGDLGEVLSSLSGDTREEGSITADRVLAAIKKTFVPQLMFKSEQLRLTLKMKSPF